MAKKIDTNVGEKRGRERPKRERWSDTIENMRAAGVEKV